MAIARISVNKSIGRLFAPLVLFWLLFGAMDARADAIAANSLVQQSNLVSVQSHQVFAFSAPSAGTLTIRLQELSWPERLANLTCSVFSSATILAQLASATEVTIPIGSAGQYYARVSATARGALSLGFYSFNVTFAPAVSAVPLPASAGLLLSALLMFWGLRRVARRNESVMFTD